MVIDLIFPYAHITEFEAGAITIRVAPRYLADQSVERSPGGARHVWSYHVRIENYGREPVQLLSRRWEITDGDGRTEVVEGPGVIGQQPVIEPGGAFDYVSGCPLPTPSGTMRGHYTMMTASGEFDAIVPPFALEHPTLRPSVN